MASSWASSFPKIIFINPKRFTTAERRISSSVSPSMPSGKSNGFTRVVEFSDTSKNTPPTDSQRCLYSDSGSTTITSAPTISDRKISNFTAYDFPAPDLANTTVLAFSMLNRSNNIKLLLCKLMPYKIPSLLVRSEETNGKVEESGSVFRLLATAKSSRPIGKVEFKPWRICKKDFFATTNFEPSMVSKVEQALFNSSWLR